MRISRFLLLLLVSSSLFAQESSTLRASAYSLYIADPGLPFIVNAGAENIGLTEKFDVVTTVRIEGVREWKRVPESCSVVGVEVRCVVGHIPARRPPNYWLERVYYELEAVAPDDPSGRGLEIRVTVADRDGDTDLLQGNVYMYRTFNVTNDAADGPGSLRDAIVAATDAGCTRSMHCKIAFRVPGVTTPWVTIRPSSPLPPIGEVLIDGRIQTRFFGDTNQDGPEVELNGARVDGAGAAGLRLNGAEVYGLTINGFGGPGVFGSGLVSGNYIGCDPTGTRAVPNERGVVLDGPEKLDVVNNVISGNRRAGVFAWTGKNIFIEKNKIGWNASGTAPLPNGASGVFLGPELYGAYVDSNAIAFNAHAGIAVTGGSRAIKITYNTMVGNGGLAVDYRLDGVTPTVEAPTTSGSFQAPRITSARYDPVTDVTVIEGFQPGPREGAETRSVGIYANDDPDDSGFGEGQYLLTEMEFATFRPPAGDPPFRFTMKGRPPGRWISANVTVTQHHYWARGPRAEGTLQGFITTTTEFGRTVPVEGY